MSSHNAKLADALITVIEHFERVDAPSATRAVIDRAIAAYADWSRATRSEGWGQPDREMVARNIDPRAFIMAAGLRESYLLNYPEEGPWACFRHAIAEGTIGAIQHAYDRADRILALPVRPAWRSIATHEGCAVVVVSRRRDRYYYQPTTAFRDVGGTWRVFRSEGGMTPLDFEPTHWMPTPTEPEQQDGEGDGTHGLA